MVHRSTTNVCARAAYAWATQERMTLTALPYPSATTLPYTQTQSICSRLVCCRPEKNFILNNFLPPPTHTQTAPSALSCPLCWIKKRKTGVRRQSITRDTTRPTTDDDGPVCNSSLSLSFSVCVSLCVYGWSYAQPNRHTDNDLQP